MFVVDGILLSPFKGLAWICREIQQAVDQEQASERDRLTEQLSQAYLMLEKGELSEAEFAATERAILDRLDGLQGGNETDAAEPEVR